MKMGKIELIFSKHSWVLIPIQTYVNQMLINDFLYILQNSIIANIWIKECFNKDKDRHVCQLARI